MQLIGCLAAGVCAGLAEHPVEEATRRLRLFVGLIVIQWERVLKVELRLRNRAVDMDKSGTLVGVVALHEGLGWLFGEADWRIR